MLWFKLGWRNIWRNPGRTLIQLLVIAGSLAFVIWMQNISAGTYARMIHDAVRMGSGHLSFHHPRYIEERLTEMFFDLRPAMGLTTGIDRIENILPRLHVPGLARSSRDNAATMMLGVDFQAEAAINPLLGRSRLVSGQIPANGEKNRAYVGFRLAESLKIKTGNKFVVMFQDFSGEITSRLYYIGGIFRSGVNQIDSSTIFVDRRELATGLGNENAVHELAIILDDAEKLPAVHAALQRICPPDAGFRVFRWEETSKQLADTIKIDHAQFKFMIFLMFVLVTIGTVNLLLMAIMERTREFGLLQALGMDKFLIARLIFCEALVLGCTGSAAGLAAAGAASFYTWYYGLDMSGMFGEQEVAGVMFEPIITSAWSWGWMFGLSIAMVILVLLASIYPLRKALRVNPAEAMRTF